MTNAQQMYSNKPYQNILTDSKVAYVVTAYRDVICL